MRHVVIGQRAKRIGTSCYMGFLLDRPIGLDTTIFTCTSSFFAKSNFFKTIYYALVHNLHSTIFNHFFMDI